MFDTDTEVKISSQLLSSRKIFKDSKLGGKESVVRMTSRPFWRHFLHIMHYESWQNIEGNLLSNWVITYQSVLVLLPIPVSTRWEKLQISPARNQWNEAYWSNSNIEKNVTSICEKLRLGTKLLNLNCECIANQVGKKISESPTRARVRYQRQQTPKRDENSIVKEEKYYMTIKLWTLSPPLRCSNFRLVHISPFLSPRCKNTEWEQDPVG